MVCALWYFRLSQPPSPLRRAHHAQYRRPTPRRKSSSTARESPTQKTVERSKIHLEALEIVTDLAEKQFKIPIKRQLHEEQQR